MNQRVGGARKFLRHQHSALNIQLIPNRKGSTKMVKKKKVARSRGEEGIKVIPELDTSIDLDNQEEEEEQETVTKTSTVVVNSVLQLIKMLEKNSTPFTTVNYQRNDTGEIVCVVVSGEDTSVVSVDPSEWAEQIANGVWDTLYGEGQDPNTIADINSDGWEYVLECSLG